MKKLIFVVAPYTYFNIKSDDNRPGPMSFPLGVLNLSATVKKELPLCNIDLVDLNYYNQEEARTPEEIVEAAFKNIKKDQGGEDYVFALSIMFSCSWDSSVLLVEYMRRKYPRSTIVAGGVHATYTYKHILENLAVDYVVRGEGEISLPELMKNIEDKKSIPKILGVYDKNKALSSMEDHVESSKVLAIDDVPDPDYSLLEGKIEYFDYKSHVSVNVVGENKKRKWAQLITSRGCPFSCPYCVAPQFSGQTVRYKDPMQVQREMRYLYENYGVTGFIPEDDFFIGTEKRMTQLCDAITSANIPNIKMTFRNGVNVNTLNERKIDLLAKMGTNSVSVAVESGAPFTQKFIIKKNVNLVKAPKVIDIFRLKGIEVKVFIMISLPDETDELREETISYAEKLNMDWCNLYLFAPLLGTEFYEKMLSENIIYDSPDTWSDTSPFSRGYKYQGKTGVEWKNILLDADLRINYANNSNILKGDYKRAFMYFDIIRKASPKNIFAHLYSLFCTDKLNKINESKMIAREINKLMGDEEVYNQYIENQHIFPLTNNIFSKYKISSLDREGNYGKIPFIGENDPQTAATVVKVKTDYYQDL